MITVLFSTLFIFNQSDNQQIFKIRQMLIQQQKKLRKFNLHLPPIVFIFLTTDFNTYMKLSNAREGDGACTKNDTIFLSPLKYLLKRNRLNTIILHELSHIALKKFKFNLWKEEGIVLYITGEGKKLEKTLHINVLKDTLKINTYLKSSKKHLRLIGYLSAYNIIKQSDKDFLFVK